jgi:hypothetical protein
MRIPVLVVSLLSCFVPTLTGYTYADDGVCSVLSPGVADQCLRLNQVQVLGTHNSYKRWPAETLISYLDEYREGWAQQHPNHLPIMVMLELKDAPRQDWGPLQYTRII